MEFSPKPSKLPQQRSQQEVGRPCCSTRPVLFPSCSREWRIEKGHADPVKRPLRSIRLATKRSKRVLTFRERLKFQVKHLVQWHTCLLGLCAQTCSRSRPSGEVELLWQEVFPYDAPSSICMTLQQNTLGYLGLTEHFGLLGVSRTL